MPVMFYKTIAKEDLEKTEGTQKNISFHQSGIDKQKRVWLWTAVGIIMAVILISWISILPKQLKVRASGVDIEKELFTKSSAELSNILLEQQQTADSIKKIIAQEVKTLAASSTTSTAANTTSTLPDKQIEELKNKIEKK